MILIPGSSLSYSIYSGLYWFIFGTACVIMNDLIAFEFGTRIGKTPLIALSPKKTVEGFIGGIIGTFTFAIIANLYLNHIKLLVCP